MVVLAIIVVLSGVVLSSQSTFNKTLVLANTAYDIALTMRSAQTYGLGSRASGVVANAGYGLHFDKNITNSFKLFADTGGGASCVGMTPDCKPGNNIYGAGDELKQTYELNNGLFIGDFCAQSSGSWSCAVSEEGGLTSLDVVFARPNPDAFMSKDGSYSPLFPVTAACITISSPQGGSRFVSVGAAGQIIANATSCP